MFVLQSKNLLTWYHRYERWVFGVALIFGFVVDSMTLRRVDLLFENLVFIGHLAVVLSSILAIHFYERSFKRGKFFLYLYHFAPILMQFSFGALFSGFVVFYFRSGPLIASFPFLATLFVLLIGNEFLRTKYLRASFHISLFFVALFSYLVFAVPIFTGQMGAFIFLLSGLLSVGAMVFLMFALSAISPARTRAIRKTLTRSIFGIFLLMNVFYMLNIIPPIPLSLKESEVAYAVERTHEGAYHIVRPVRLWYEDLLWRGKIEIRAGDPIYFYSAIFAPTSLNVEAVHHWQYFDENKNEWVSLLRISFPMVGGRDGGYRGYSVKHNVVPGLWRVSVQTTRGQTLGRVSFDVTDALNASPVESIIR